MEEIKICDMPQVRVLGRRAPHTREAVLFWTGSGVEMNVRCSELWLEVEADYDIYEPWISWSVNGAGIGRMPLSKGRSWICLFRGLNAQTVKYVRVLKEVQAMSADASHSLTVHALRLDGEVCSAPVHKYKLEFIGDSITSGEGSIGAKQEEDWVSMIFSAAHSYAVLASDRMDAEFRILSQSGWGTYVSWDNHPDYTLPPYYEQVCGLLWGEKNERLGAKQAYDFSAWQPDAVIINLGTNDNGAFYQPAWTDTRTGISYKLKTNADGSFEDASIRRVMDTVKQFLGTLRRNNPNAQLVWVYGMLGQELAPYLEEALREYCGETGDTKAAFLLLPDTETAAFGARSHPGLEAHRRAAEQIVSFLSEKGLQ